MDIKQAEAKVFSNDLVARRYASERVELAGDQDSHRNRISYLDSRIDEIADRNPVSRLRHRSDTTNLEQQRNHELKRVEQLDQQIARLQQDAEYRQHRLGGHDHDTHHLQQHAATRGTEIDRLLTGDVTARTHRRTTPGHVQELERIAGPFPGADHINEWVTLAVHLLWADLMSLIRCCFSQHGMVLD